MRFRTLLLRLILMLALPFHSGPAFGAGSPGWLRGARIATPYDVDIPAFTWEIGVDRAVADGATVILDWTWVSNSWRYLFEPQRSVDLQEMSRHAAYVHANPGVRYIVYFAPLEWVSWDVDMDGDGRVDPGREEDSLALEHPDWAQVGIDGRRAVFFGTLPDMPFWVCPTCEDVWVTPAHPEYRSLILQQVRLMAATGLDGIWLDVPFLRSDFGDGWTDQWPDMGSAARSLFSAETGLVLPPPPLAPAWNEPAWRGFIRWRYRLIRGFLDDIRRAALSSDPELAFIVESSVGFGPEQTQTAASPFEVARVVHATAHEAGETRHAVQRSVWLHFLAKLAAWRHADARQGQPSWLLTYVEAGRPETEELVRTHAAATVLSGFTPHVSGNEGMTGSPSPDLRKTLFSWVRLHRDVVFPRGSRPLARTALLFSRDTLDFRVRGSWEHGDAADGFMGMAMLLLEGHVPYEVISDEDLGDLDRFSVLILPGVEAMSEAQAAHIAEWVRGGGRLLATGLTSAWDGDGAPRTDFALAGVFGVHLAEVEEWDGKVFETASGRGRSLVTTTPHERRYYWAGRPWAESGGDEVAMAVERKAVLDLLGRLAPDAFLETDAPPGVLFVPSSSPSGAIHLGIINLKGTAPGDASPDAVSFQVTVALPSSMTTPRIAWLPFLGQEQPVVPLRRGPSSLTVGLTTTAGGTLLIIPAPPTPRRARRVFPKKPAARSRSSLPVEVHPAW
ncbi:MAG: hypothetical protein GXP47_07300 [Acidobacteria bacterium]|nr:hypothetical protein [Acidobacteriota bacterium]